jgi:hypothetical protein
MSQNTRYREPIDACRPGSADLALPALADLARAVESDPAIAAKLARSQRFDVAASAALHDVPMPAGLLERLEAKLAEVDDASDTESTGEVSLPPAAAQSGRRTLLVAALALAAVTLLAVGATLWPRSGRNVTNEQLVGMASGWNRQVDPAKWTNVGKTPAPAGFAVPVEVRAATQWQSFATPDGQRGVVYNLTTGLRPSARLYVISSRDNYNLPTTPYRKLKGTSGGVAIGAWQAGGLLYVVVVDENGQKLSDFVSEKQFALALPAAILAPASAARPA